MVPLKIVSNVSRFKPALNLNRVLADLNRGSNSLNSMSERKESKMKTHNFILDTKLDNLFYILAVLSLGQYFMICIHYFSNFTNPNASLLNTKLSFNTFSYFYRLFLLRTLSGKQFYDYWENVRKPFNLLYLYRIEYVRGMDLDIIK